MIVVAVMALAAITAMTAAAAVAEPGFLPKSNFIGKGTGGKLVTTNKGTIECGGVNILSGVMETDSHGTADIHYEKCKAFGLFAAKSLGDASETILAPGSVWLLCLIEPKTLVWGLWVEVNPASPVHVEAGGKLVEVKGGIIGKITENKKSLTKKLEFKQKASLSDPSECTGTDGKVKKANQLTQEDGKAPETSALEGNATVEAEDKKTEMEIMDA
jgi:hypothetical protein